MGITSSVTIFLKQSNNVVGNNGSSLPLYVVVNGSVNMGVSTYSTLGINAFSLFPSQGTTITSCTGFMVSKFPISATDIGTFAATNKAPLGFAGISWSVGQPAPVPSSLPVPVVNPPTPPTPNQIISGVGYQWTAQSNAITALVTVVDGGAVTPNPNSLTAPKPPPVMKWTSAMVLVPLIIAILALLAAASAIAVPLLKHQK